jgi:hypothetical protein
MIPGLCLLSRPNVISVMTTYLRRERDGGDAIVRIRPQLTACSTG